MKSLAARTRKYLAEVEQALKVLEGKIAKHGG
jgi:BMFP domain-containing protein YqiC